MHTFTVDAPDVSSAWTRACQKLDAAADAKGYHTVVRIADPRSDDLAVREELDRIRVRSGCDPIETVANTIFPAALAATCDSHEELVVRYRAFYERLLEFSPRKTKGTYFGRMVAYPGRGGLTDQIGEIIARIRQQTRGRGPLTAAYEASVAHPGDALVEEAEEDAVILIDAPVRVPAEDTALRDFPCLSHCSFQLDRTGTVHTLAYYRSQYMVDRAYGNYLGLGRINAWVARHSGQRPGTLTVVAGYAQIEAHKSRIRPLLSNMLPLFSS